VNLQISIVTPSFNQGAFIEATLQSVLTQSYPAVEYLVMDGGSTDETPEILERYRPRIKYLRIGPDDGQTDAIANGFALASGDILGWLNSDDLYAPGALAEVAEFFMRHPAARFVFGDSLWVGRDGTPIKSKREIAFNRFVWLRTYNYIPQPSAFWRRELYEAAGGMDRSFDLAMDTDLFARFADITTLHHVPRVWSHMRRHPEQKNQVFRTKSDLEDDRIRRRYLKTSGARWILERALARAVRVAGRALAGAYRR
jgi:glycosyltransferase involved in cell wall biosynthesis